MNAPEPSTTPEFSALGPHQLDALAFEYQRDYGSARWDGDIPDGVNDPASSGECSIFRLCFSEETPIDFDQQRGYIPGAVSRLSLASR